MITNQYHCLIFLIFMIFVVLAREPNERGP